MTPLKGVNHGLRKYSCIDVKNIREFLSEKVSRKSFSINQLLATKIHYKPFGLMAMHIHLRPLHNPCTTLRVASSCEKDSRMGLTLRVGMLENIRPSEA